MDHDDPFVIGGKTITSRLITGSGKYHDDRIIAQVLAAACCDVVTVALRRIDLDKKENSLLQYIPAGKTLLPNTSGARNAKEAVRIAHLAREIGCGNWIKIEIITDQKYLMPDNFETVAATQQLVKEGFVVFPYMCPELSTARRLVDAGAAAIMPLGAPIGSNRGLKTRELIEIIREEIDLPVIIDAGIGLPSHAAAAMEMGADAVLLNTAIASSNQPVLMAQAFRFAVQAGRLAYLAGRGAVSKYGAPSSPITGFLS
ncbi:MAG: thiazole synthase [Chitinivibrionales bacterium]|nr:thiazole synthase [Chitinivibrionales bacterium]